MTFSSGRLGNVVKVDGLSVADELVVLHTYPRAKRDLSLANVGRSAAAGALADLVMAGRVGMREVDTTELKWWKRRSGQNEGAHRIRPEVENSAPLGDDFLDSVVNRLQKMQGRDLPWCINHMEKMWRDVLGRLYDTRVKLRGDVKENGGGVDPHVEQSMKQRIHQALIGPGAPDDHTAAVVLLAHAAELFKPGSRERDLVGPFDDAVMTKQIAALSGLPSMSQVQVLAKATVQVRNEEHARNERSQDAVIWHS